MKYSLNISSFIFFPSFLISLRNSSRNFNGDILHLVFVFVAFVTIVVSGVVQILVEMLSQMLIHVLSKLFIGNNLLLKLLRAFSIVLKNNRKLFKRDFFNFSHTFIKFFNSLSKLLYLLSGSSNDKYPSCITLRKQ